MNADRKRIGKALTAVLDAAEKVGVSYESAVGFFSETDYQLIRDGEYQSQHIEHALRHAVRRKEWTDLRN